MIIDNFKRNIPFNFNYLLLPWPMLLETNTIIYMPHSIHIA